MLKHQLGLIKDEIARQTKQVLGVDRRRRSSYRKWLEINFKNQTITTDRELFMTIITREHRMLCELAQSSSIEEVFDMIKSKEDK